ncbi:MAG: DUF3253 domain-containing protein [Phycisphaerales bacterium]
MSGAAEKICPVCGRPFAWRRKWANCWNQIVYCSDACRRTKNSTFGRRIESAILALLNERAPEASICPSEAARRVDPGRWRALMPEVHSAARRLARARRIEVTRKGEVLDPGTIRGPVRLRLTRR